MSFEGLRELQWETFLYEMSCVHNQLLDAPESQVGERLREAIAEGIEMDDGQYHEQRARIDAARRELFATLADADCVLWPAAPGTAPEGLAWTGDPRFISPWTALGGPVVTVPAGFDAARLREYHQCHVAGSKLAWLQAWSIRTWARRRGATPRSIRALHFVA